MKILALEFSSEQRSAAIVEGARVRSRAAEQGGRRAVALVEEALRGAQMEREEIGALAIGLGPGSYTGIRGAIAFAQGFALASGTPLLGASSVTSLAEGARRAGLKGDVHVIVDAQRNEFYLARFELQPALLRETQPLRLAPFAEIEALAAAGATLIGPDVKQTFPQAQDWFPDATDLGLLAAGRTDFIPGEQLEPIYLREINFKKSPPWRTA